MVKQIKRLDATKSRPINNRKLARLIVVHNKVLSELMQINQFFCEFVGFSLIHFFVYSVLLAFIVLSIDDWRLKTALAWIVIVMHLAVTVVPSVFASTLLTQVIHCKLSQLTF